MKKSLIIFFVILIITSAYAQVQITDPSRQTDRVINLQIPEPPIFNNATANVNSSEFAHIWITNEGNMDNVPDLYPTLDTRFCRFEDCVNISGDTMTGDLFMSDATGIVVGHTSQIDFGAIPEFQVLGTGGSDASMGFARFSNNAGGATLRFLKSRSGLIGVNTIVQDGDELGRIRFQAADGTDFNTNAAEISAEVDGTPGSNDMPGRIIFSTTSDGASSVTERMRITNDGRVGINTTSPTHTFNIVGDVNLTRGGIIEGGDLTLNDGVSLLLGTSGAEGQIFSDGIDFNISSLANKNLNIKAGDFLTGLRGSNITIIGSDHTGGSDADGGYIIIKAGDGGVAGEEAGSGGFIWLEGGIGTVFNRGVHVKSTFSAAPGVDTPSSLYVEGALHVDSRSIFEKGTVCNELGGSLTTDDCVWESNTESLALFLDASLDHLFINVESNFTENATFVEDVIILGTLFGGSPVKIAGINVTSGNLIVDTSTFFVDSINNRVGIGTANPTVPLTVIGVARVSTSVNSPIFAEHGSASNANIAMSVDDTMTFDTGGLQAMHIDASQNVIIGDTTTADGLLNVFSGSAGTVTARPGGDDLVIEHNTNAGMSILTPDTSTSTIIFGSPTDPLGADLKWNHDNNVFIIGSRKTDAILRLVSGSGTTALEIDGSQNFNFQDGNLVTGGDLNVTGNFNWASYLSITTTADSIKTTAEFNVFDRDNYVSYSYDNNSNGWRGMTYHPSTGNFTVSNTGVYAFTIDNVFEVGSTTPILYIIRLDGVDIYNHPLGIHPSVDPALTSLTQIRTIQAGSNLTFHADSTSSPTLGVNDGTTFSIWRIS